MSSDGWPGYELPVLSGVCLNIVIVNRILFSQVINEHDLGWGWGRGWTSHGLTDESQSGNHQCGSLARQSGRESRRGSRSPYINVRPIPNWVHFISAIVHAVGSWLQEIYLETISVPSTDKEPRNISCVLRSWLVGERSEEMERERSGMSWAGESWYPPLRPGQSVIKVLLMGTLVGKSC